MGAFVKRLGGQLGFRLKSNVCLLRPYSSSEIETGKQACLVDTLSIVRSLEAEGIPSHQAEAITGVLANVLNESLQKLSGKFVTADEMKHTMRLKEVHFSTFKSEVKCLQDNQLSILQMERMKLESALNQKLEKLVTNIKMMHDALLARQTDATTDLANKFDWDTYALNVRLETAYWNQIADMQKLRAQMLRAKYEFIKCCLVGALVSLGAYGVDFVVMSSITETEP